MEKNIIETHEWKTQSGLIVTATCFLTLSKKVYADGDNVEVACCDKGFDIRIKGMSTVGNHINRDANVVVGGVKYTAAWGKLAISKENLTAIDKIIAKIDSHPTYVAKQAKIKKNQEEIAEMEASRKANGYCERCGSYCYGDCQSN